MTTFIPTNSWPKTDRARQFFLFATRVKELMHPQAQDIYRVHAMSSIGKVAELEKCCGDVLNRKYPKATLTPMLREVNECIDSDPIIKKLVRSDRIPVESLRFEESRSTETLLSLAQLWRQLLESRYEETLKAEIFEALKDARLKKKMQICAKLYASHLLYRGMHREYVLEVVDKTFFSRDIGQCTDALMQRFFSNFSDEEKDYDIVFFGSQKMAEIFHRGPSVEIASTMQELEKFITAGLDDAPEVTDDRPAIVFLSNGAKNAYAALKRLQLLYALPVSFKTVYPSQEDIGFEETCLVVEKKTNSAWRINLKALSAPVHSFTSRINYSQEMFSAFIGYTWSVTENGDHSTFLRIQNSLDAANSAISTDSPATQLVSLWSAFEALLPPPARDEKSVRINHFVEFIVPCVARRYLRGKFRIFIDDASQHSSGDLIALIGGETRSERPRRLAEILVQDTPERKELFTAISDSPILLHRLFELGKLVQDPSKLKSKQAAHEERVSWQIYRIYRERNLIVHSGVSSDCLPILVENLFLYYRLVIRALQQMHARFGVYQSDSALELVSAVHSQRKMRLEEVVRDTGDRDFHRHYLDAIFGD